MATKKVYLGDSELELATMEAVQEAIAAALPAWLSAVTGTADGISEIKCASTANITNGTGYITLTGANVAINAASGTASITSSNAATLNGTKIATGDIPTLPEWTSAITGTASGITKIVGGSTLDITGGTVNITSTAKLNLSAVNGIYADTDIYVPADS